MGPKAPELDSDHTFGSVVINGGNAILGNQYLVSNPEHDPISQQRLKLCESLAFAEINVRYGSVNDAHFSTFEWIFDRDATQCAWDSFPEWLTSGHEPYLIEGKAGSGKSTFMRFIFKHWKTLSLLPRLSEREPLLLQHFFWLAGNEIQRSFKGMLATLAFQLANRCHNDKLTEILDNQEGSYWQWRNQPRDWSEAELEALVWQFFDAPDTPFLVLIDALDEFDHNDRPPRLVQFLQRLCALPHVKLCISSRPLVWVEQSFGTAQKLILHDLTQDDIRSYASDVLAEEFKCFASDLASEKDVILNIIVSKAEGVFLWVRYALHSLAEGIGAFDAPQNLRQRLEELPKGMEELFQHMWQRLENSNQRHQDEASTFLACGELLPISLLEFLVIVDPTCRQHYVQTATPLDNAELRQACESMRKKLMVRTAGLMICPRLGLIRYNEPREALWGHKRQLRRRDSQSDIRLIANMSVATVTYLHRTVHSFLWETPFGLALVNRPTTQDSDLCYLRLCAGLALVIEDIQPLEAGRIDEYLELVEKMSNKRRGVALIDDSLANLMRKRLNLKKCRSWYFRLLQKSLVGTSDLSSDFLGRVLHSGLTSVVAQVLGDKATSKSYKGYIACIAVGQLGSGRLGSQESLDLRSLIKTLADGGAALLEKHRIPLTILPAGIMPPLIRHDDDIFPETDRYLTDVFLLSAVDRLLLRIFFAFCILDIDCMFMLMDVMTLILPHIPANTVCMVPILDGKVPAWQLTSREYQGCDWQASYFICAFCNVTVHSFHKDLALLLNSWTTEDDHESRWHLDLSPHLASINCFSLNPDNDLLDSVAQADWWIKQPMLYISDLHTERSIRQTLVQFPHRDRPGFFDSFSDVPIKPLLNILSNATKRLRKRNQYDYLMEQGYIMTMRRYEEQVPAIDE